MVATKATPEATRPISAQDIVAILAGISGKIDKLAIRVDALATQEHMTTHSATVTPSEASAILRAGRKGKASPAPASQPVAPDSWEAYKAEHHQPKPVASAIGKVIAAPSKKAAKAERAATNASNSAKYTCACGGWGVQDGFRDKHVAKGHTVTQLR